MSDTKISALPAVSGFLARTESVPLVQSGVDKIATPDQIAGIGVPTLATSKTSVLNARSVFLSSNQFACASGDAFEVVLVAKRAASNTGIGISLLKGAGTAQGYTFTHQSDNNVVMYSYNGSSEVAIVATGTVNYNQAGIIVMRAIIGLAAGAYNWLSLPDYNKVYPSNAVDIATTGSFGVGVDAASYSDIMRVAIRKL